MAHMPSARTLLIGQDIMPEFELVISGKDAGRGTELFDAIRPLISSVIYEEDEDMAALFELRVINQPDDTYGNPVDWTAVLESKAFQEGNYVDLWMGYGFRQAYMGRVEIVKWLPKFPPEGAVDFRIRGYDGRHRMTLGNQFKVKQRNKQKKRKTFYKNMADETIIKRIADKYGYGVDVDQTETKKHARVDSTGKKKAVFPTRVQASDITDWEFLQRLAQINRFDLWVDYSLSKKNFIIHFKKRHDIGSPEFLFTYNGKDGSLIDAEPDFAVTDQVTDVEVLHYDHKKRKIERSVISDINPAEDVKFTSASQGRFKVSKELSVGARVRFSAFGQVMEAFSDRPFKSKAEAKTFVTNWLKERERDMIILSGRVIGVETLRPRQVHQIEGLGKRIDGLYRFTQVRHDMSPGKIYDCKFVAHKVLSQELSRRKATTKVVTKSKPQVAG